VSIPTAPEEARTVQRLGDAVERVGDRVWRPVAFWSSALHGLLGHLETVDFPGAPRQLCDLSLALISPNRASNRK